jgi:hypothetical protein
MMIFGLIGGFSAVIARAGGDPVTTRPSVTTGCPAFAGMTGKKVIGST